MFNSAIVISYLNLMNKYPKILIITHNSFDHHRNNGKTFNTLFYGWDSTSIAQLYFSDETPESSYCKRYFRITDKDIFNTCFSLKRSKICGGIIQNKVEIFKKNVNLKRDIFSLLKLSNKGIVLKILRDLLWSTDVWKTQELIAWLNDFKPEVVFWGVGESKFSADIAYWISIYLNIPLCLYYGDDYVLNSNYGGLLKRIQHKRIKYFHDRNLNHSKKLFAIGDLMAMQYQKAYGKEVIVVRTSTDINEPNSEKGNKSFGENIILSYVGGLHLDRWRTLVELGILLNDVQSMIPNEIVLNIYTLSNPSHSIINKLNKHPLHFCGSVYGTDVNKVMLNSDILVHVESFDLKYRKLTSLSISTKIPEYLAVGKCLLFFGPNEVASIKLISDNNIGITLTDIDTYNTKIDKLKEILLDNNKQIMMGCRAQNYAIEKFNRLINNEVLRLNLIDSITLDSNI